MGENGTTAAAPRAVRAASGGTRLKMTESAFSGTMSSFWRSFRRSATGCSSPEGPTIVGPSRVWSRAANFRSNHRAIAVAVSTTVMMSTEYTAPWTSPSFTDPPHP